MKRRGVALVVIMLVTGVLAAVALGLATTAQGNLLHAVNDKASLAAIYAAQAGIQLKSAQLRGGDTTGLAVTALPGGANVSVSVTPGGSTLTLPTGSFTVPGPATDSFYLLARGRSPNGSERQIGTLLGKSSSLYNFAAFVEDHAVFEGVTGAPAFTDTWDSSTQSFVPAEASKARLGTNGSSGTVIELKPDSYIGYQGNGKADVVGGPGAPSSIVSSGPSQFGTFQTLTQNRPLDPVVLPPAGGADHNASGGATIPIVPGAYKDITASGSGSTILLDTTGVPGPPKNLVYTFSKLELLSLGAINVSTPPGVPHNVTIYVHNDVKIQDGAILNDSKLPARMQFKLAAGKKLSIEKLSSTAYCVVYAPEAEVLLQAGQIYGSVVAKTLSVKSETGNSAAIHYDRQLDNAGGGPTTLTVRSVQVF